MDDLLGLHVVAKLPVERPSSQDGGAREAQQFQHIILRVVLRGHVQDGEDGEDTGVLGHGVTAWGAGSGPQSFNSCSTVAFPLVRS